jgi:hypothetical protein
LISLIDKSAFARSQSKSGNDALKIFVAVVFDLNSSPFFSVAKYHVGPEVLLQSILQILDRGSGDTYAARALFPPRATDPKLPSNEPFRRTNGGIPPQNSLRHKQLFVRRL